MGDRILDSGTRSAVRSIGQAHDLSRESGLQTRRRFAETRAIGSAKIASLDRRRLRCGEAGSGRFHAAAGGLKVVSRHGDDSDIVRSDVRYAIALLMRAERAFRADKVSAGTARTLQVSRVVRRVAVVVPLAHQGDSVIDAVVVPVIRLLPLVRLNGEQVFGETEILQR